MSNAIASTPHNHASGQTPAAMDHAIDQAVHDLQTAAGQLQTDSNDLVSTAAKALNDTALALVAQVRQQSSVAMQGADREVRAHPLAVAGAVAVAAAAVVGLVVASLNHTTTPAPKAV